MNEKEELERRLSLQTEKSKQMEVENALLKERGQCIETVEDVKNVFEVKFKSLVDELKKKEVSVKNYCSVVYLIYYV